jgi:hypothetical protein
MRSPRVCAAIAIVLAIVRLVGQQPAPQTAAPAPGAQTFVPPNFIGNPMDPPAVKVPDGFAPIFNGRTLAGWHVSRTNHHGRTPDFFVMHGVIVATQNPLGGGGILLTDKTYKNFELYMEVKPDWGCDSGIFLRSTESGAAYQVTMDFLPDGGMGDVIGEGGVTGVRNSLAPPPSPAGRGATPAAPRPPGPAAFGEGSQLGRAWVKAWKRDDWNTVRVRMEGDVPHVTVWFNDQQVTEFTDVANHAIGGITEGPIAIQVHGAGRWVPGGFWRWRNLGIRELT